MLVAAKDNGYLEQFVASLGDWTDERFITRRQLRALAMYFMYLVNLSEEDGWQYDGHSMKVGVPMCVFVVKATIAGIPHVVFTSARTTIGCVVTFVRKLEEDLLEWRVDQYRQ